jgi:hypothetical protein
MTDSSTTEQMPATVREWTDILARIRFGKVKAGGRTITGATIKLVAGRLADYADSDGTRVRPGVARVAVDLELDYRTARLAVAHLRSLGLLGRVRAGGRRGADTYRLTLPVDLLDRDDVTVWSPTQHRAEIDRLSNAHRRLARTPDAGPDDDGSQGPQGPVKDAESLGPQGPVKPVDNSRSLGPQGPVEAAPDAPMTGPSGTPKSSMTGPTGPTSLGPVGPATDQDLYTTTTDHPDGDPRTAVTGPRATGPATNPESPPRPKRCQHGLSGRLRGDGRPECALCRVAENRPAVYRPPPAGDHLAPVIQLHTREAS